jgi:hypothetical protein
MSSYTRLNDLNKIHPVMSDVPIPSDVLDRKVIDPIAEQGAPVSTDSPSSTDAGEQSQHDQQGQGSNDLSRRYPMLLDDCMATSTSYQSDVFRDLMANGRHYNISTITHSWDKHGHPTWMQQPMEISPKLRAQLANVYITNPGPPVDRQQLYSKWFTSDLVFIDELPSIKDTQDDEVNKNREDREDRDHVDSDHQ